MALARERGTVVTDKGLLVVDVQNDFVEGGALGCAGGRAAAADITDYVATIDPGAELIIASRDEHLPHSDNGGHISDQPDFVATWPAHCIRGTVGQEYAEPFVDVHRDIEVAKGQGVPAYSAFEGHTADGENLDQALKAAGVTKLDVCGIATDYCVRASALDALKLGYEVRLLTRLCAAVNPDSGAQAIAEMRAAGVQIIGA